MKKFLLITLLFSGIFCQRSFSQTVKLTALYDYNNSAVKLNWNMVNSNQRTSYILLRSSDGVTWTEAAKDRMLRNYTEDDIYFFNDRRFAPGKNYYRIRISDNYNNTIALSPIVAVNTGGAVKINSGYSSNQTQTIAKENISTSPKSITQPQNNNSSWILYPNPATDLLKLTYRGSGDLKGVVNVQIQDMNGKTVVKFRSGSKFKTIEIPVSNLQKGVYSIQLTVLDELMVSQKFIKQ